MPSEHITLAADRATNEAATVERVTLQSGALSYLKRGTRVEVEFPTGWQAGWIVDGRVADVHKDNEGRTFKHRYNVRHKDGRELREIHPLCARAAL